MSINKVIFLDIDGVLNSRTFYVARQSMPKSLLIPSNDLERDWELKELDLTPLALLARLVKDSGAKIVVSSTWRHGRDPKWFAHFFTTKGIPFKEDIFVGCTSRLPGIRGLEIQDWMKKNKFNGPYVIIDDDCDMLQHQSLVKCDNILGFTWHEYNKALIILGECDE